MNLRALSSIVAVCACSALPASANIVVVTQTGFGFSPSSVTVQVGDTVHWVWTSTQHSVTEGTDGTVDWDEPIIGWLNSASTSFDFTFDAAFVQANPRTNGRVDYFCENHWPGMKGIVFLAATGTPYCFGDASASTPCPCANTGLTGRGCNNSTGTGGAKLSANGSAPLDAFTLTATNMINSATAIFLQGDATLATAQVFGDGLRCVAGSLKRIGVKTAVLGTTSYPGIGDATVATRSAALGDTIPAGGTRYYLAYYRDSSASFCTASTFNSTNGLQINY